MTSKDIPHLLLGEGITLAGATVEVGTKSHTFRIGREFIEGEIPPYLLYFLLLLDFARGHLKQELSLQCVELLSKYTASNEL
jgi:hypothetical protein